MGHYHNKRRLWSLLAFLSLLTVIWGLQESPGPQDSRLLGSPRSRAGDNDSNATRKRLTRRSVLPINPWMTDIRSVLAEVKRFQDEGKKSPGKKYVHSTGQMKFILISIWVQSRSLRPAPEVTDDWVALIG